MRRHGSVLVVVLGLLAILSVIGVAFITMSGLDRSTSASFAMQTQLSIAADGAVDYVCHYLVDDVWTDDGALLTGTGGCERYDYPGDDDLWLAARPEGGGVPSRLSFQGDQVNMFKRDATTFIAFGGTTAVVDNDGDGTDDGIWIPELAAPFDQYIVRISVTVLDHAALRNVNAHGYISEGWEYATIAEEGCFISDVDIPGANNLLSGSGGVPGRWGTDGPGNAVMGETIIENPQAASPNLDLPFTLDEEFELRRYGGTDFQSRLEHLGVNTDAMRLKYTTVSWTAEVCGDGNSLKHVTAEDGHWSAPKADLNLAEPQEIHDTLLNSGAFADLEALQQFVANIIAFRDRDNTFETDFEGKIGAERQPFFSEIVATGVTVKVEVFNPWPGDSAGQTGGLTVDDFKVRAEGADDVQLSGKIPYKQCTVHSFTVEVDEDAGGTLWEKLGKIELVANDTVVVDRLSTDEIKRASEAANGRLYRTFSVEEEKRASNDLSFIPVVFIYEWQAGGAPNLGTPKMKAGGNTGIPIRILNSVSDQYDATDSGPLSPYPTKAPDEDFKALVRLGDLNQVMCPSGGGDWWSKPWAVRVTEESEDKVKFNWVAHRQAADVLCVQGPWTDGFDNDGDGETDLDDMGTYDNGRFAGPEFRIAGKINLNTATGATRSALPGGGVPALTLPLSSITEIISDSGGPLEARDEVFTRLSNIVTVRSDVFSVYGTVQILDPAKAPGSGIVPPDDPAIVRSRRFWALVDRSPSLAYPPVGENSENFIHPRIMNFQWME